MPTDRPTYKFDYKLAQQKESSCPLDKPSKNIVVPSNFLVVWDKGHGLFRALISISRLVLWSQLLREKEVCWRVCFVHPDVQNSPVTLCNFLSNLSRNAVAWRIAQCNMGCLAIFLLCKALHKVELGCTFRNGLQQLTTPLHSVSPLQQLVSQFYGSFSKGACAHFLFFVPKNIARQVAEKIAQCNRASTPNLSNLQRYIFNHCETSC